MSGAGTRKKVESLAQEASLIDQKCVAHFELAGASQAHTGTPYLPDD